MASAGVPAFESQRWRGRPILLLYSLIPWDILDHLGMAQLLQNSTQGNVLKTCVFFQHYVLDTQKLKHYLTWGDWSEIPAVFFVDRNESHIYTLLCLAHRTTSCPRDNLSPLWWDGLDDATMAKLPLKLAKYWLCILAPGSNMPPSVPAKFGAWWLPPCIRARVLRGVQTR